MEPTPSDPIPPHDAPELLPQGQEQQPSPQSSPQHGQRVGLKPNFTSDFPRQPLLHRLLVLLGFRVDSSKGRVPTPEDEKRARQRKLVFMIAVSGITLLLLGTGVWMNQQAKQSKENKAAQAEKAAPPQQVRKTVELKNTDDVTYAIAGEETDAQGRKVEHILRVRESRIDGNLQIEENMAVDGVLAENWQPMDAAKAAALKPAQSGVPQSNAQIIYAYGGGSTAADGRKVTHVAAVDLRTDKPRLFTRDYVDQKPVSPWSRRTAFKSDQPLSAQLSKTDTASTSTELRSSNTALYSHAGKHTDAEGHEVEYILYTYWEGFGEAAEPKTLVNRRVNGQLAPTWTYLEETPIDPKAESTDLSKIEERDPSKIYAYAGKKKTKQGGEIDYYVVLDRYQPNNEPKALQLATDKKGAVTLSEPQPIQNSQASSATPFISSATAATPTAHRVERERSPRQPIETEVASDQREENEKKQEEEEEEKEEKEKEDDEKILSTQPVQTIGANTGLEEEKEDDSKGSSGAGGPISSGGGIASSGISGGASSASASTSGSSAGSSSSGSGGSIGSGSSGSSYGRSSSTGGYEDWTTRTASTDSDSTSWSGSGTGITGSSGSKQAGGSTSSGSGTGSSGSGTGSSSHPASTGNGAGSDSFGEYGSGGSGSKGSTGGGSGSGGTSGSSSSGGTGSSSGGNGGGAGVAGSAGGSPGSGGVTGSGGAGGGSSGSSASSALTQGDGAIGAFSNLFLVIRRFSLIIILIGAVIGGILFVLDKKTMAIGIFAAAIIIGGAPTVVEMIFGSLQ